MSAHAEATGQAAAPGEALAGALDSQPGALAALRSALADPRHAYLFSGPTGSGKATAARAFAAEIMCHEASDPTSTRERVLADPSPHPDLTWLAPAGTQHLVEDVREQVIGAAALRPLEASRRVFVLEHADRLADESQNALLKTLEEPPEAVLIVLLSAEPARLLATVRSRCQPVRFRAMPWTRIEMRLQEEGARLDADALRATARLSLGDLQRARLMVSEHGIELRGAVERSARAARDGELGARPWDAILELVKDSGDEAERLEQERLERERETRGSRGAKQREEQALRRARRAAEHAALDLALLIAASWWRDLAALCEGARDAVLAGDRLDELERQAQGLDGRLARRAAELTLDTRLRLEVNVGAELALEALLYRAGHILRSA